MSGISEFQYRQMLARTAKRQEPNNEGADDETDLQQDIRAECARRGWICFCGSMAHRTHRTVGEPDCIIAATDGRTLYVELKSRSGKTTPAQNAILAWLAKNGQRVAVVKTLQEFITFADA